MAIAACASWTFGGKLKICGQPEKIQPEIKTITKRNFDIFDNSVFHNFELDIVFDFAILCIQMPSGRPLVETQEKTKKVVRVNL